MGQMFELEAFATKAKKPRWLVRATWVVGWQRDFILDQTQAEALIAALKPGEDRQTLVWLRDTLIEKGHWGVEVKVEKTETPATPLIKPPPAVVPGNTGVRKVETAKLAEPKKKAKAKAEPKAEVKKSDEPDMMQSIMAMLQAVSTRLDAMEEAATAPSPAPAPASAGAGPDF